MSLIIVIVAIGMEKYNNRIPSVYYREAIGILLVYNIDNPQSLDSVEKWWEDACTIVMRKDGRPIPAVLLANKVNAA